MSWELGVLDEAQEARLSELGVNLDSEQRFALRGMAKLQAAEVEWRSMRLAAIFYGAELADAGTVDLDQVLKAMSISRTTWLRRRAELRAMLSGGGQAAAGAAGDQAVAGAPDGGRDVEGNL